jgi:hypothetical protein
VLYVLTRGSGEAPRESHKLQTSEHFGAAQPNMGEAPASGRHCKCTPAWIDTTITHHQKEITWLIISATT